jgi:hypothetical protein
VATTEWVRAQISGLTGISLSETDPIWIFEKALYYTKLQADARYLQSFTETDPTVSAWAKASVKPSYAYSELTGLPTLFSGAYADLTGKPTIPTYTLSGLGGQPLDADLTAIAALAGTAGFLKKTAADTWALDNNTYLTSYTETDPIWTAEKTNYALKTYVDTSISNLVASAPAALNTLNELALALGSDANFSTTIATSIGNKVPYTGATQSVALGLNNFSAQQININGNGTNNANLYLKQGIASLVIADGFSNILATGTKIGFQVATSSVAAYYADFQFSSLTAQRTYTLPDATGTLALTSNLSSYVPYTGATGDVNTGNFSIYSNYLNLKNALYLNGDTYNGAIVMTSNKGGQIYATTNSINITPAGIYLLDFTFGGAAGGAANLKNFRLNVASLNVNELRTYTMPNASGTLALTSDIVSTYVLPIATTTALGGVKVDGTTILINATTGIISGASTYTLPIASTTVLGGIKVGTNLSINATTGVLSSTDTTYAVFTGATALLNGSSGLVTAPVIADRVKYLKGDGTWGTPTDTDTTYAVFTGSTTLVDGAAGLVPKPVIANRLQYLRGDGTWATPPDTDTDTNTVTSIRREDSDGTTAATTYRTGDIRLRQGANVTITEVSAGIFQIASSYVDTDTNTWNANSKTVAGYVAAPGDVANKVWKTNATGEPAWRDDADTDTNTTYTASTGLTLTGTAFSVTKTITAVETADTIALRNASGQLVATGFYQASSRELKTNINLFTRSALDIIRDVTVVSFNYKTDVINKHIGFIAEDTPEELSTRNKNVMDANNTIGVLLKAVQELEARIKQLESK